MQQVLQSQDFSREFASRKPLMIPRIVFNALHPFDQLAARALEKVGKVRIIEDTEQGTTR